MYKIAIIIPYFGKLPDWIDLFLYSCSCNAQISKNITCDWFIFTDNRIPNIVYPNIHCVNIEFRQYCEYVSEVLKIDFHPETTYKLCDLKPFYGILHKDKLINFTHWGFGDLDLCYGDLSVVVNETNLNKYDVLTTHADRVAGHFTIIRLNSSFTDLCLNIKDWKLKLVDKTVIGLDELDWTILVRPSFVWWWRIYRYFISCFNVGRYSFMKIPNRIHNTHSKTFIKEFNTSPLPKNGERWIWDVKNNHMINPSGNEIPYLHFLFFKKTPFWNTPNYWKPGFYCLPQDISVIKNGYVYFDNKAISYQI